MEILVLFAGAFIAGIMGSLTGLGGGVILIPLLSIGLSVPMPYAVGASLVAVIGTSSGAAAAFVKEGFTNIRLGIFLEVATTVGAIIGAMLSVYISSSGVGIIFGLVLWLTVFINLRFKVDNCCALQRGSWADRLHLYGSFPKEGRWVFYSACRVWLGFLVMAVAGVFSGLLGIGAGALKVLAMDGVMKIPFRVSTTTSNFMMGVTAASGAFVYFQRGQIISEIVAPVLLGAVLGSFLGSKIFVRLHITWLRGLFLGVVVLMSSYMIYKGIMGDIA